MNENTYSHPLDELVKLDIRVTERERRSFKVWCSEQGISQDDAFREAVALLKNKDG